MYLLDGKDIRKLPFIVLGLVFTCLGVFIYIALPQALIHEDIKLLFQVYFVILVAMIIGTILFVTNFIMPIERFIGSMLFCCERKDMKILLKKNLVANKQKKKCFSIIYSIIIGCIFFLLITVKLGIKASQLNYEYENADIVVIGTGYPNNITPSFMNTLFR